MCRTLTLRAINHRGIIGATERCLIWTVAQVVAVRRRVPKADPLSMLSSFLLNEVGVIIPTFWGCFQKQMREGEPVEHSEEVSEGNTLLRMLVSSRRRAFLLQRAALCTEPHGLHYKIREAETVTGVGSAKTDRQSWASMSPERRSVCCVLRGTVGF